MCGLQQVTDRSVAIWNETDGDARRRHLEELRSAAGRYRGFDVAE